MEVGSVFRPVRARIFVVPLLLLVAFAIYYPFSPASQQRRGMAIGQRHVSTIEAALAPFDAEELQVGVSTYGLGTITVHGEVADEETARSIRDAVVATKPPITTRIWLVGPAGERWLQETVEPAATGQRRE